MEISRILDDYRNHTILTTNYQGTCRGRAWKENKLLHEIEGSSIENTLRRLKQLIDARLDKE